MKLCCFVVFISAMFICIKVYLNCESDLHEDFDVKHLLRWVLDILYILWGNMYPNYFFHLLIGLSFYYWEQSIFVLDTSPLSEIEYFKYFLPFYEISFHCIIFGKEVFNFSEVLLIYFCLCHLSLLVTYLWNQKIHSHCLLYSPI